MKCPLCGKTVGEPGACRQCLPYNIYTIDPLVKKAGYETLRKLMIAKLDVLRTCNFGQLTLPIAPNDKAAEIDVIECQLPGGQTILMLPCLDERGYQSVAFIAPKSKPVQDGPHRVRLW